MQNVIIVHWVLFLFFNKDNFILCQIQTIMNIDLHLVEVGSLDSFCIVFTYY